MLPAGTDTHDEYTELAAQLVKEHSEILQYFPTVKTLKRRAEEESLELVFHVFADRTDDFVEDPGQALLLYLLHRAEGTPNVRLCYELYEDRENDVTVEENHMIGYGGYPN